MNNLLIIGLWVDNLVYYYLFGQESNAANLQTLSILAAYGWPRQISTAEFLCSWNLKTYFMLFGHVVTGSLQFSEMLG